MVAFFATFWSPFSRRFGRLLGRLFVTFGHFLTKFEPPFWSPFLPHFSRLFDRRFGRLLVAFLIAFLATFSVAFLVDSGHLEGRLNCHLLSTLAPLSVNRGLLMHDVAWMHINAGLRLPLWKLYISLQSGAVHSQPFLLTFTWIGAAGP